MSWTKKQIVEEAYAELGYAEPNYDLLPQQIATGLRRLDAMIADWNLLGIKVPFPVPDAPQNSNVNDDTNLPDGAWETVYTNLAIRIGPTIGRQVSVETKQIAKAGYDALLIMAAQPYEMQFPNTLPIGQGTKPWRRTDWPYVRPPRRRISSDPSAFVDHISAGYDRGN